MSINKNYENLLFPIFLIAMGIISVSGVSIFGSAALEGAAWKQNVMFAMLIIFGMLPPFLREMKATWMVAGYALAFFMFGGANIIGTVGIMLGLEKIVLAVLILFLGYRLWYSTWKKNKLYIIFPVIGIVFLALLFPIEDKNIVGSGMDAVMKWSKSAFTSDGGFHIFLGLVSLCAGISEILISRTLGSTVSSVSEQ
ncbi:MAG: hypothetical protein K2N05_05865 [Muribaculaceae bacterium]|nr:hypothetical protein [Muribaculaceae bacterium]